MKRANFWVVNRVALREPSVSKRLQGQRISQAGNQQKQARLQELHRVTTQKSLLFIVTAVSPQIQLTIRWELECPYR
jgi:hypothetical protein